MVEMGYTWDDVIMFDEKDLRRSPLYENIFREATHPYEWMQYKWRRERFFKVDRVMNGFEVPNWL